MKTHNIGLTGWWSFLLPGLRKPIELPFAQLVDVPDLVLVQRVWSKWQEPAQYLIDHYQHGDKVVILGHSYGASAATLLCARLAANNISVDLLIAEDQGLDSVFIRDVPIGGNVREVDEYHVVYEKLKYAPSFKGKKNFQDVSDLPGGHTSTFTNPAFVSRIVNRIIEVHES